MKQTKVKNLPSWEVEYYGEPVKIIEAADMHSAIKLGGNIISTPKSIGIKKRAKKK